MARQKLSEYKAKSLLFSALGIPYGGVPLSSDNLSTSRLDQEKRYVVKVDQGIKKRFKNGLVKLDVTPSEIEEILKEYKNQGFTQYLIEEYVVHPSGKERFLSIERVREGMQIIYSTHGGVDIESHKEVMKEFIYPEKDLETVAGSCDIPQDFLNSLILFMNENHISFLEINPFLISNGNLHILDLAIEVDSTGSFFVENRWTPQDFVSVSVKTSEEKAVETLSENSQAAFSLSVLNPNGSLFMLLSGGGASVVLADEVHNKGFGHELANYGEYSGNPNAEETYLYTQQILSLLLKSKSSRKVLIIAGGVANFTDIRVTFKGIIKALEEKKEELKHQKVKVFVRRGGPYQTEGLKAMKEYLEKEGLIGAVAGPEMILSEIIKYSLQEVNRA